MNKLIIDSHEYDLDRLLQHRATLPEIEVPKHQIIDPRLGGQLIIRYFPEVLPDSPAYTGATVFLEYDRVYYALVGREALYAYLDGLSHASYTGLKISKVMLKKIRLTQSVIHEDADPLVVNQSRMRSDERNDRRNDTRQPRFTYSNGYTPQYNNHPSTSTHHSERSERTGSTQRPASGAGRNIPYDSQRSTSGAGSKLNRHSRSGKY